MKKNTVITIVIAMLLCVVFLGLNPMHMVVTAQEFTSETLKSGYDNPCLVTFTSPNARKTLSIESGAAFGSLLPALPDEEEGKVWYWSIDDSGDTLTSDTDVNNDMSVTAIQKVDNLDKDFMDVKSGVLVTRASSVEYHEAAVLTVPSETTMSEAASAKTNWLAVVDTVTKKGSNGNFSGNYPAWTFEFTGSCKSDNQCFYYVMSSDGKYLQITDISLGQVKGYESFAVRLSDAPARVLVVNKNPGFSLGSETGTHWLNLKKDNVEWGFQGSGTPNTFGFYSGVVDSKTIAFDVKGGNSIAPQNISAYSGDTITLPDYSGTKNSHSFLGWTTDNPYISGTSVLNKAGDTFTVGNDNITFFAVYDENPILWFEPLSGQPAVSYISGSEDFPETYPEFTREGYRLVGWTENPLSDDAEVNAAGESIALTLDGDKTLYAKWQKVTKVTFVPANATQSDVEVDYPGSIDLKYGEGHPGADKWMYINENGVKTYVDGMFTVPKNDITLYEVIEATITFDADGGKVFPASITKDTGSFIIFASEVSASRGENFNLLGWKDENDKFYDKDDQFEVGQKDQTLTAVWGYTVAFDVNGGKPNQLAVNAVLGDSAAVFPSYAGKKNNNDFIGWTTKVNADGKPVYDQGDTLYQAGQSLEDNGEPIAFKYYAIYKVTLNFNNNGGGNISPSYKAANLTPYSKVNLDDYKADLGTKTFMNAWSETQTNQTPLSGTYTIGAEDHTLYAVWGSTVTFEARGINNVTMPPAVSGRSPETFTTQMLDNYLNRGFLGWTDGTKMYDPNTEVVFPSVNTTLYAVWDGSVTVTFNVNGGSSADLRPITQQPGSEITFPSYDGTKTNMKFIGWTDSSNLKDGKYHKVYAVGDTYRIPLNAGANITFYAAWDLLDTAVKDNVKFGIRLDGSIPYEPSNYAASLYTTYRGIKEGNIIKEGTVISRQWVADNDPSVSKLNSGDNPEDRYYIVNDVTSAVSGNVPSVSDIQSIMSENGGFDPETEYVLWYVLKWQGNGEGLNLWHVDGVVLKKNLASLVYDGNFNGTAGNMPTGFQEFPGTTVKVGDDGKKNNNTNKTPTRTDGNYTFIGWNTQADGSGTPYRNGAEITLNSPVTILYAQWAESEQTVTLKKEWTDDDNVLGLRPDSVAVTLKLSTGKTYRRWISAGSTDADGNSDPWTVSVKIPVYDGKNNPITWTWQEDFVPNYERKNMSDPVEQPTEDSDDNQTLKEYVTTLENELKLIDVSGKKTWVGQVENETTRPNITVQLYADGVALEGRTAEVTEENLTYKFEDLPEYTRNGQKISYTVQETTVPDGYDVSYNGMDVTNTHYELSITVGNLTKSYDGNPLKMTNSDYTVEGLHGEDSIDTDSLILSNKEQINVGKTEDVEVSGVKILRDGEDVTGLYTINQTAGSLEVTPATVKVTVDDATKVYGDQEPDFDIKSIIGRVKETDSITWTSIERKSGENVGEYTITATGDKYQGNYEVTYEPGTLTITPRPVTVTADPQSKIYGDDDPNLTAEVKNLANGDKEDRISYTISRAEGNNVGSYTITPSGAAEQGNYTVTYYPAELTITPRELKIVAKSGSKPYDGTPIVLNDFTVEGTYAEGDSIARDSVNIESVSDRDNRVDVNSIGYSNIPTGGEIYNGKTDVTNNYKLEYGEGTLKIEPISVKVTSNTATKSYDGEPLTDTGYSLSSALVQNDKLTVNVTGSQTAVGTSKNTIDQTSLTIMNGDRDVRNNYNVSFEEGTLTVTSRQAVTITALSAQKVYDGQPLTRNEYQVAGLADGDRIAEITITGSVADVTDPDAPVLNVPSDARIFRGDLDVTDTYDDINYYNGTLVVTPKSVTIQAGGGNKVYDGTPLTVHTNTSTGLVAGHYVESLKYNGIRTQYGTVPNIPEDAVIFDANGTDVTANYEIDYLPGELKVLPRPVIVTADSFSKEYGMIDPEFTARVVGTLEGESISYQLSRDEGEEPKEYAITPTGMRIQGSYEVTYIPGTLTITFNPAVYSVEKVWADDNNRDGRRPISLGVSLIGSDGSVRSRRLTEDNKWTVTITDLPLYNGGTPVTYSWVEETVDGYTGSEEVNGNITTFTNTHEIARTSASVVKIWDDRDNAGGTRPATLGVILFANGERILGQTLSDANDWTITVENLPMNENGRPIEYIWYERTVSGGYYAVSSTTSGGNTTLVNSNLYNLIIHYHYVDGSEAHEDYKDRLPAGGTFVIDSPELQGYTASQVAVVGMMPARDLEITVIYTAEGQTVVTPTPIVPTPVPTAQPEQPQENQKEVPQPRTEVVADEEHPVVVPVPTRLVDIDDLRTALGLGEVIISNHGFAIE